MQDTKVITQIPTLMERDIKPLTVAILKPNSIAAGLCDKAKSRKIWTSIGIGFAFMPFLTQCE